MDEKSVCNLAPGLLNPGEYSTVGFGSSIEHASLVELRSERRDIVPPCVISSSKESALVETFGLDVRVITELQNKKLLLSTLQRIKKHHSKRKLVIKPRANRLNVNICHYFTVKYRGYAARCHNPNIFFFLRRSTF